MSKVFRLQENVPDVYPRKSRDFQLFCNLFDLVNSGVKFDIDSIRYINDTQLINESLIPLLQTKLGFFTQENFTAESLRIVLQGFVEAVRNKGSETGINEVIQLFLKVNNIKGGSNFILHPNSLDVANSKDYYIEIFIKSEFRDTTLLREMLRYVLPTGYRIVFYFYGDNSYYTDIIHGDNVTLIYGGKDELSAIQSHLVIGTLSNNNNTFTPNSTGTDKAFIYPARKYQVKPIDYEAGSSNIYFTFNDNDDDGSYDRATTAFSTETAYNIIEFEHIRSIRGVSTTATKPHDSVEESSTVHVVNLFDIEGTNE